MKNCRIRIKATYHKREHARAIFSAIEPDIASVDKLGTDLAMTLDRRIVVLEVRSADMPTLRASVNSYLRLIDAAFECLDA